MSWDWDKLKEEQEAKRNTINNPFKKKEVKYRNTPDWNPIIVFIILGIILVFGFWNIARWANYTFSYEKKIQQIVIEMVKPESLKDEYKK
jgi:hypothetical protein